LGITVMIVSLQINMPRYFIENYHSIEKVGVFTIFYYFIVIGGIIINSVCQYLSPYYSKSWSRKDYSLFFKYIRYSWIIAGLFGIAGYIVTLFFGNDILHLIYDNKFDSYTDILNILMIAGVFVYLSIVNGYVMTSIKVIKAQVPMFAFLLVLTTISSWYLIPKYDLVGAAWVSVISAFTQFVISSIILIKKFRGEYVTT
ncbi:polysaccharide biosynthesis C-terminal domain-containing protein, partial [Psychrobacter sp. TAE2020]|uniref:lipopolysaccharide biosynthesis protein n=1 Tax=Psychrobacter sp. TAE2020 TaxID=2846762 RepID=UPI001C105DA3